MIWEWADLVPQSSLFYNVPEIVVAGVELNGPHEPFHWNASDHVILVLILINTKLGLSLIKNHLEEQLDFLQETKCIIIIKIILILVMFIKAELVNIWPILILDIGFIGGLYTSNYLNGSSVYYYY